MQYLNPTDKYWAIDLEGDGLLDTLTTIWCLCAVNILTGEEVSLVGRQEIKDWIDSDNERIYIAHNGIGYDAPALVRILGCSLGTKNVLDTLVLSMVFAPSLDGGHSLEAWGQRLKFPKTEWNDFSRFSEEMLTYCMNDTRLCRLVYLELVKRMSKIGFTEEGLKLEHQAWALVKKQQENGFAFNIMEANILYGKLRGMENDILERLQKEFFPAELKVLNTYKRPFKADGTPTANFLRHQEAFHEVNVSEDNSSYTVSDYVDFMVSSPNERVDKLLELGWEPKEFTPTGRPKPTDKGKLSPSLEAFVENSGEEGPRLIAQWIEVNSRANTINTWIEAYNERTGCIHGSLWLANTLRYRHSNPNTANIPAVRVDDNKNPIMGLNGAYTYEARDLWTVRSPDRRLVGVDAKGIQLRVLAHYLNNPKFTEAVLDGDPHSYNQEIGGFATRAIAKTFIYAFLLGCGDGKAGQIIGGSTRDGREVKKRFIGNFPGLGDLLNDLERQVERTGRIRLCDGTPLRVSQPHTRLGYLLQGDESRIMKRAAIISAAEFAKRKIDIIKVGDIHDEWQNDTAARDVEEVTESVFPYAFSLSGKSFEYRLPIDCDCKVGMTWAQTH